MTRIRTKLIDEPSGEALFDRAEPQTGGDSERAHAFRRLADAQLREAYRLANAILAEPAEAQDAVHDAFVKAWDKWPTLHDPDKFEAWFKRIVVNTCRNRLRSGHHRLTLGLSRGMHVATPDPADPIGARDEVERALRRLKPDDRVVLALRYYRDLKVADIAELLDIPPGTATSRLRNAHIRLRAALERGAQEGQGR